MDKSVAKDPKELVREPSRGSVKNTPKFVAQPYTDRNVSAADSPGRQQTKNQGRALTTKRYVFSVDDDEDEVEAGLLQEYMEGYSDNVKRLARRTKKGKEPTQSPKDVRAEPSGERVVSFSLSQPSTIDKSHYTTNTLGQVDENDSNGIEGSSTAPILRSQQSNNSIIADLVQRHHIDKDLIAEESMEPNEQFNSPSLQEQTEDDRLDPNAINLDGGANDTNDNESISSVETFTLRERQDAINTTHPFGIRIWKPALYKKIRSVQTIADNEIHSTPNIRKKISWDVKLGYIFWIMTSGIILFLPCFIGFLVLRGFFFWSRSSTQYAKQLLRIATYFLFPFGKVVQLSQDENYILEDVGEGRSLNEYESWRRTDFIEAGRLFFGPPSSSQRKKRISTALHIIDESIQNNNNNNNNNNNDNNNNSNNSIGHSDDDDDDDYDEDNNINDGSPSEPVHVLPLDATRKRRLFGRGEWTLGRFLFFVWFYVTTLPLLLIISFICWLGVFSIPMAKVLDVLSIHIQRHPLALKFNSPHSAIGEDPILLCTYRAFGWRYYKYTVDGTNIILINLMSLVLFVIFDYYILKEHLGINLLLTDSNFIFLMCLASVIPLAYFIGQAVASISAQSSMGLGAVINAFFSTIVEVFLYCIALNQEKAKIVEGGIIGSILGAVLLLPGLSMCAGALERKTQRYNPRSAGVSSTMMLFATVATFAPTLFYEIFGTYEIRCVPCIVTGDNKSCERCHFYEVPLQNDNLYLNIVKPFSYLCAVLLFLSYCIGLWFTLRTHAALIWQAPISNDLPPRPSLANIPRQNSLQQSRQVASVSTALDRQPIFKRPSLTALSLGKKQLLPFTNSPRQMPMSPRSVPQTNPGTSIAEVPIPNVTLPDSKPEPVSSGGHDAPNWSRKKSSIILLGATILYAVIAEILVGTVDGVLKKYPLNPRFVGLTIFALVPNTTEFLNAISFAMHGNVALSMEIGTAYSLQVYLLQIPALVLYSLYKTTKNPDADIDLGTSLFNLIFPRWDVVGTMLSVFLFTYIYAEGKSNYFKGSILVLIYVVVLTGFYFTGVIDDNEIFAGANRFVVSTYGN